MEQNTQTDLCCKIMSGRRRSMIAANNHVSFFEFLDRRVRKLYDVSVKISITVSTTASKVLEGYVNSSSSTGSSGRKSSRILGCFKIEHKQLRHFLDAKWAGGYNGLTEKCDGKFLISLFSSLIGDRTTYLPGGSPKASITRRQ